MIIINSLHNRLLNSINWYNRYHQWEHHHKVHWAVLAVYVLSVVSFGFISFTQVPKASATDPEITLGSPISGVMPSTASVTIPPDPNNDNKDTVYDFGTTYSVTSYQITLNCSAAGPNSMAITLYLSTDNSSWSQAATATYFPGACNGVDWTGSIAGTPARYAKWNIWAGTSGVPNGTYTATISSPHLYGTGPPTVSITTPADNDTGDDPSDIYYTNTTPQTGSGTATSVAPATISGAGVTGNLSSTEIVSGSVPNYTWTGSGIALSPGSNTWTVTATDSNGYTGSDSQTIFLDTTNPVISANTPSCSTTNSVAVTGTASDSQSNDSGLKTTNPITYTVDGGSTQNASGSTSWTATASSLTEGDHTVAITATDKATNTASTSKSVQYDPTAPSISITSGSSVTGLGDTEPFTLTGTTSDATSGVATVSAGSGTTGTTSWSRAVTLSQGSNSFTITATDTCGNSTSTTTTVTYTKTTEGQPDTTNPTITITSPTTESTYATSSSSATISGTASDETSLSSVTCTINSGATQTATGTTTWSLGTITLTEGTNTIVCTGHDASSNIASDTLTITYTPNTDQENCDLTAPTVADCGDDDTLWGTFTITAPNGNECFLTGVGLLIPSCLPTTVSTTTTITWEYTQGTIEADHLKLAYSTDNGISWYSITENTPLSPASYTWTLPTLSSTQMIISGTLTDSTGDTISSDSSDAPFTIRNNRAPEIRVR